MESREKREAHKVRRGGNNSLTSNEANARVYLYDPETRRQVFYCRTIESES